MDRSDFGTQTKTPFEARRNAESYEEYMGRWSRLVAREFVKWLAVPEGKRWLDVGCGTGSLTQAILELASPQMVRAVDSNGDFIDYARNLFSRDGRVVFQVADYGSLLNYHERFDAVVSGLFLNFASKPSNAIDVMKFVTDGGGVVGAFVWDYTGRMEMLRLFWDAAMELDPAVSAYHESFRFTESDEGSLRKIFKDNDLQNIDLRPFELTMRFRNFDDFWLPFRGGQGPAPVYLNSLDTTRRDQIKERLKVKVPTGPDGSIELLARAWGIRGYKKK